MVYIDVLVYGSVTVVAVDILLSKGVTKTVTGLDKR